MRHFFSSRSASWQSDAGLMFAVLVWGINFVVIKAALALMHPHLVNAFRFTVSVLVLGGLYAWQVRQMGTTFFAPFRRFAWPLILLGLLGYFVYQYLFITGIARTTAGNAALIMSSSPLWTALVGRVFGLERLGRTAWLGLALSLVGTMLVVAKGTGPIDLGTETLLGNLLMLGAALAWGAYTGLTRPVLRHVTPRAVTFLGLLVALPLLFGLAMPYVDGTDWSGLNGWFWLAILYSGGLSTGITIVIWNRAVQVVGPSQTAVYGTLVPLIALFGGVLFLAEPLTLAQLAGGGLTLAGLFLMRRDRRPVPA